MSETDKTGVAVNAHGATVEITIREPGSKAEVSRGSHIVSPEGQVHHGPISVGVPYPPGYAASVGTAARSALSAEKAERARHLKATTTMTNEEIAEDIDRSPRQVYRYLNPRRP